MDKLCTVGIHIKLTFLCRMVNSVERLLARLVQNEDVANLHVSTPNLAFAGERVSDAVHIRTSVFTYTSYNIVL